MKKGNKRGEDKGALVIMIWPLLLLFTYYLLVKIYQVELELTELAQEICLKKFASDPALALKCRAATFLSHGKIGLSPLGPVSIEKNNESEK